ncbi:hypothetical protein [uncultured Sphingomonas sp.]|uniref:hypothetical protein n=1 Tax=uncultured Sphingomonas sp. TaxID=158754 RepID=UPI0025FB7BF7|nr:hypothetical protein [uncultured Sphingomonas sp.]
MIAIAPMVATDALVIQRQASQRVQLGIERDMSVEEARDLAEGAGEAWTVRQHGRIVACLGLRETFPGAQAVAWAILSDRIGTAHLAVTRHARRRIAASPLARIEAIVREAVPAELAWAMLVGLQPAHVLRRFGQNSETHILCERIREGD